MPSISRWMIGFGLLLIVCQVLDQTGILPIGLQGRTFISGWAGGLLMVAAALSAAQRRPAIRLTGLYVGLFLPLALTVIFAWHAIDLWRERSFTGSRNPTMMFSALALASLATVVIVIKLWPRQGIASRGYAIPIPSKQKPFPAEQKPRRSAG